MSCIVEVNKGWLEGRICESHFGQTYYSFEGIPYAKPPVGKLRFRAPQECESWSGVRDATKPGHRCAQVNPYGNLEFEGSEDCLYLNVYTPSLPANLLEQLPVLFFVHGGRLIYGYGDYYRPDYLIRHNVILVTINYRLHILGFLCLDTPEIPGNAGMKDTVMALKWVNENIKFFNGNPGNVTVFGESAGSSIVTSYLSSKMADGLYDKVISQSGHPLSDLFMVEEDDVAKGYHIAEIMGKSTTDLGYLSELLTDAPLNEVLNAVVTAELGRPPAIINAYFLPVVEKEFEGVQRYFVENPLVSFKENRFEKVPILVSTCSHEAALFLRKDDEGNIIFEEDLEVFIPRYLSIKLGSPRAEVFVNALKRYYFKDKQLTQTDKVAYLDFISDAYFARDIVMFLESVSQYTNTFACYFAFNGDMNTRTMRRLGVRGASHGDLVQYLFFRDNKVDRCGDRERTVVDVLCEAWCNFAKTGKPSWSGQAQEWLPYNTDTKLCLKVDDEIEMIPYPNFDRFKIWFDLAKDKSKL